MAYSGMNFTQAFANAQKIRLKKSINLPRAAMNFITLSISMPHFNTFKQREGYDKSFKRLLGQGIFNYAVENNQITDTSDDANQYDHPNCVGASLSKFIRQGLFLFLFLTHWLSYHQIKK